MLIDENGYPTDDLEQILQLVEYVQRWNPPFIQTKHLIVRHGTIVYISAKWEEMLLGWYDLFEADVNQSLTGVSLFKDELAVGNPETFELGEVSKDGH